MTKNLEGRRVYDSNRKAVKKHFNSNTNHFCLISSYFLKISPFNPLISDYQSSEITKEDLQYLNCLKSLTHLP